MKLTLGLLITLAALKGLLGITDYGCVARCTSGGTLYSVCVSQCSD